MSIDNKKQSATTIARLVESEGSGPAGDIKSDSPANAEKGTGIKSLGSNRKKVNILKRLLAKNMLWPKSSLKGR